MLVFVTSLDGKITNSDSHSVKSWSSKEDQDYFKKLWDSSEVIVMGSSTYKSAPAVPNASHHLVVMTRTPEKYKDKEVPGQLEFTTQKPVEIVEEFKEKGLQEMLVVGGAHIATSFLKAKLIDEIWLTIEPKVFGAGSNFVIDEDLDVDLQLISVDKVNERGTLITKYTVV